MFSITKGCPRPSPRCWPSRRAISSVNPPGGKGTTILTGRRGHSCDCADVAKVSIAKAAADLRITQPAVSRIIAELEHALGVKLLDRSPRGVEVTMYGRALLRHGAVAFDEIKQAIREIEFLANPNVGEIRIGCPESIA